MPTMGKPVDSQAQAYRQVTMAPKKSPLDNERISANEKEKLLNKITGYKPKSIYTEENPNKMGKDEFLKLLTHQLKNQDPMNPMEQNKMAAELAQFSQLEQLSNINTKFDTFNNNKAMETQFYGASFLGKEVVTTGQSMDYKGEGTESSMMFKLEKNAAKVLARVYDKQNNIVGEVWKENIGRGNQNFSWDGSTLDGSTAGKGEYSVRIFAWDESSEPINVETKVTGIVESVFFENGETVLQVDGKKVFLRDVDSFHMPGAKSQGTTNSQVNLQNSQRPNLKAMNAYEANSPSENFPIDSKQNSEVNLNTRVTPEVVNQYKKQDAPTTGLTNVYDVE